MIKGVNRQIIEINETQHKFFERVFLFVRPQYSEMADDVLRAEANQLIQDFGRPPRSRKAVLAARARTRRRGLIRKIVSSLLCAGMGAGVLALFQWIF